MAPGDIKTTQDNKQSLQSCRRRLQTNFDESDSKSADRSVLSVLTLNANTRKALRNGVERLSKTLNNVRTTVGALTQKLRVSTKRRQILEEDPMTPHCATPHTFSKQVLGRTPTKLYSPFGIETPGFASRNKENRAP